MPSLGTQHSRCSSGVLNSEPGRRRSDDPRVVLRRRANPDACREVAMNGDLLRSLLQNFHNEDARFLHAMLVRLEELSTRREYENFVTGAVQIAMRRGWLIGERRE